VLGPLLREWAARHRHEVRGALASSAPASIADAEAGQAVVLLDSSRNAIADTELAARLLAALPHRPEGDDPPLVVTALAAWLTVCRERAASPPVPILDTTGRWQIVQAHSLRGGVAPGTIAITLAVATPAQLAPLALAAAGLTPREREITALVLAGLPTTEIATVAHIAPYTVQDHLRGVFRKLEVADRHQLTARLLHWPS
jgi:DNA-binding CsgD family transcriptional regulator